MEDNDILEDVYFNSSLIFLNRHKKIRNIKKYVDFNFINKIINYETEWSYFHFYSSKKKYTEEFYIIFYNYLTNYKLIQRKIKIENLKNKLKKL
jgi:hypothetical protein